MENELARGLIVLGFGIPAITFLFLAYRLCRSDGQIWERNRHAVRTGVGDDDVLEYVPVIDTKTNAWTTRHRLSKRAKREVFE